jgi:hypothetical protein
MESRAHQFPLPEVTAIHLLVLVFTGNTSRIACAHHPGEFPVEGVDCLLMI